MTALKTTMRTDDGGFTLVELLIVIVILGILAGVVAFSVGSIQSGSDNGACKADRQTLETAATLHLTRTSSTTITPANATLDGYEQTLVDAQILTTVSRLHDLDAMGDASAAPSSPC